MAILQNLTEANARIAALEAQLAAANKPRKITFKVTAAKLDEKSGEMKGTTGAISVYGLGRFPITLYKSQWDQLFAAAPELRAFMVANAALLATKG